MKAPLSTYSVISSPSRLGLACAGQAHLNPLGKCMSFRSVSASMSMSALSSRSRPPGVLVVRSRRRPLRILVVLVRPQRRVRLCSSARTRSHHTCALQRSSCRHSPDAPRALDVDVASKPRVQAPLRRAPPMRRSCSIWTCYRCCLRRFAVLPRVAHAQGVVRVRGHRAIIPVARQSHRHIVHHARHTHTHNRYRYHPHHAPIGLSSAALTVARYLVLASLSLLFIVFARLLAVLVVGLLAWRRCCRRVA